MELDDIAENNKELIKTIIKSQEQKKMKEHIVRLLIMSASHYIMEGMIYPQEWKGDLEYVLLQRLVESGLLSEGNVSRNGSSIYSLFKITQEGLKYLPKLK